MKNYLTKTTGRVCIYLLLFSCMLLSYQTGAQNLQNPNATPETKSLWLFLNEVYKKKILSGQCNEKWLPLIQSKTGKQPAILALDFDGICPSQGGNNGAAKAIDWVKNKGGIVQFQWHWISPNADGDYYSSNFKLGDALNNPSGQSYKNMIRDIDLVAGEIKKMQDAGVPILWRPMHESEGAWFWWGMSGKDALIKLYRLMYDRYTNYHKLNNIIWIWNSYGSDKGNWYPGDDVCDIIAWDYESSSSWSQYQTLFGNKGKIFGLAEEGKHPDPNNFAARSWSFFICWDYMIQDPSEPNQDSQGRAGQNPTSWTQTVYNDSRTLNLGDLPAYNVYGRVGLVSNAGPDQTITSTSGSSVQVILDGSASKTTNGTISSYVWKEGTTQIATGVKPTVTLSVGVHTITLTVTDSNGKTASDNVVVSVKLPNIALNKPVTVSSTEAGANVAANAVDGNATTRWSSLYADPQWIQVDLQGNYNISAVTLNWEAASGKDYKIEVSSDATTWTTVVTKTGMAAGARIDNLTGLTATGRYVRMSGTARTTAFGYSLFEFEVSGAVVVNGPKANAGADQSVTDADNSGGEQITLDGSASTDATGTITSYVWKENGTQIATGVKPLISLSVGTHTISLTITNSNNVIATDDVVVTINPFVQVNLALNKPVAASSTESGSTNVPANAVDGNATTRWSSLYADPQWIQVDLQSTYSINRVVLNWETAAAKDYRVDGSNDGITWVTLLTKTAMPAGPRIDNLTGLTGSYRYIRITCTSRTTQWGDSLYEFEVYGTTVSNVAVTGVTLTPGTATLSAGQTQQLTATVAPSNATNKNVSFTSSNTSVATVNSSGLVTAIANGSSTITVTTQDGNKTATSTITVSTVNVPVSGVTLAPTSVSLSAAGQTQQLTATVSPANATNKNVSYVSSNTSVATVSSSGLVTAVANGTATITVTTQDGGKTATSAVTVNISACSLLTKYGVPRASALPSFNTTFPKIFVLGSGGPDLSNVSSSVAQWELQYNGLWQFAFNTSNGSPDWYVNLIPKTTQTFNSSSPACKITASGIAGFDGDYWVNMDGANFVMVAKSGNYAIYFSTVSTAPSSCNGRMISPEESNVSDVTLYPTEVSMNNTLHVILPAHMVGGNVAVMDINGRRIKQQIANGKLVDVTIDQSFNRGMYLLNVSKNKQVYIRKFMVK